MYLENPEYFNRFDDIWLFMRKQKAQAKIVLWIYRVLKEKEADGPYTYFRRIRAI